MLIIRLDVWYAYLRSMLVNGELTIVFLVILNIVLTFTLLVVNS